MIVQIWRYIRWAFWIYLFFIFFAILTGTSSPLWVVILTGLFVCIDTFLVVNLSWLKKDIFPGRTFRDALREVLQEGLPWLHLFDRILAHRTIRQVLRKCLADVKTSYPEDTKMQELIEAGKAEEAIMYYKSLFPKRDILKGT